VRRAAAARARPIRGWVGLVAAALVAGCGRAAPFDAADLSIRVTLGAEEAAVGRGVPLTVVRTWREDLVPEAFSERVLSPLTLRLESTETREGEGKVEETRRYRAYAFRLEDASVPAARMRARPRDGGEPAVARAEPLSLRVRRTVDPASAGEPELPEAPAPPTSRLPWVLAAAAAAVLGVAVALLRRRRLAAPAPPAAPPIAPPPGIPAHERALADLRELRARAEREPGAAAAVVEDAASVVRRYVAERFATPALRRTTEELLADASLPSERGLRGSLAAVLRGGDLVKYARRAPPARDRDAALDAAADFVSRTAERPA
jgi:hypothetical protein